MLKPILMIAVTLAATPCFAQSKPWKMPGTKKANPPVEEIALKDPTATWRDPLVACALLDGFGLKTRGWKNEPRWKPENFWCSAPYTPIHKDISIFVLCLAYYVDGTRDRAEQLKIVMSVNDRRAVELGHTALALAGTELSKKSLGAILPNEVLEAVLAGEPGKWKVGKNEIEIQREDYLNGWGYDLKFLVR